jgi:mRNA (guanine-N7-)-methyltransferase
MLDRAKHERGGHQKTFTAQFITADCTKQRLRDLYEDRHIQFDLVSCQFSFHYSFESLPQAEMMLQNACENLKPGGYFIGTLPNAYELIKRYRAASGTSFGNEVYQISFESPDKQNVPLFGAKYHFRLEGVVDCPEFVVYFPLLEKMAEKYNMKLVFKTPFAEFFGQKIQTNDGRGLIGRMQGLEPYPPDEDVELMSKDSSSYDHAKKWMEQKKEKQVDTSNDQQWRHRQVKIGTLSRPEWEASSVYLVFAFQRCPTQVSSTVTAASPTEDVANEVSRKRKHEDECK